MAATETRLRREFALPVGLIERNGGGIQKLLIAEDAESSRRPRRRPLRAPAARASR
jgi:hypothetical protein